MRSAIRERVRCFQAASIGSSIDAACNSVIARCKELLVQVRTLGPRAVMAVYSPESLLVQADKRQVARLEMQHYREKVVKLGAQLGGL